MTSAGEAERIELEFWEHSMHESPTSNSLDNILNKASEARVFLDRYRAFESYFAAAESILELGGGQCWSSCIVKRFHPDAHVTGTDLSPAAIASVKKWLPIFGAQPDRVVACRAYETPFAAESFDLVYAFSAAHHFHKHGRCLMELRRILKPGGVALYLSEPSCNRVIYRAALIRVNRKRPDVPEDVLVRSRLRSLAVDVGLEISFVFSPTLINRGPIEGAYYFVLNKFPLLQYALPCTADIIVRKPTSMHIFQGKV
jgi:ubiquinone/menaquinone biosynthesis C-methylase UbiE